MKAAALPTLEVLNPAHREMITDVVFIEPKDLSGPTDLSLARAYIGENAPRWLANPGAETPEDLAQIAWLCEFYSELRENHPDSMYFRFAHDACTFRAKRKRKGNGDTRLTLRKIPEVVPDLTELATPPYIADLLLSRPLKRQGGLVLVVAPVGQGKSTTLAATIKQRLKHHGGQTLTIEHPIEHYLDGFHGTGECIQTEVASDEEGAWAHAIRDSLGDFSVFPGGGATLFISEIRDGESAVEALRAAQAGYLVFATLHAQSTTNTVFRLITLASRILGEKIAADMVASALRLVVYQTLTLIPQPIGWKRGSLDAELLFNPGADSQVAKHIRDLNISQLADPIEKQRTARKVGSDGGKSFEEVYVAMGGNSNDLE